MDNDDPIKQIAAEVLQSQPTRKPTKTNRTLSLEHGNFVWLQQHCKQHGYKVSDIIDKLIAAYRASVESMNKK